MWWRTSPSSTTLASPSPKTDTPMATSGFWYYGRLRPPAATRFNVQEHWVAPGVRLEALHDGIALWSSPGSGELATLQDAADLMRLIVAAYALISGVALDVSLDGWIEAKEADFDAVVVGFVVDPRGHDPHLSERSRRSVDLRRAARLGGAARPHPAWRLAIRDVHAALADGGDDAFVYAYRSIEDLARGASGRTGELQTSDWHQLHTLLGTNQTAFMGRIAPLQNARRAASHGDESDPALIAARSSREAVVGIGREIVGETLEQAGLPIRASQLR